MERIRGVLAEVAQAVDAATELIRAVRRLVWSLAGLLAAVYVLAQTVTG